MQAKTARPNAKILIVDDSPEIIDVLSNTLPKDLKRQVALSGDKALKILNSDSDLPDLILLDVIMPGMDGYEVCRQIKNNERLKDIPVIFISALNETFDKVHAFQIGAVDYVAKPFQLDEVMARVKTHLEISRSRKAINDLYSKTIQGTISAMNDMLAMANPVISRISNRMGSYAELILKELDIRETWDLKAACVLSGLGMITESMKIEDEDIFDTNQVYKSLDKSARIIGNIPNFDAVTDILSRSVLPLPEEYKSVIAENMPTEILKGQIMRILIFYIYHMEQEKNSLNILDQIRNYKGEYYSREILDALTKIQISLSSSEIIEADITMVKPKMILAEDLYSVEGKLLLKTGYELSDNIIFLLSSFSELKNVKLKVIEKL